MKSLVIKIIEFYQKFLSPDQSVFSARRKYCVFYPSCSQYTKEAVLRGGAWYGLRKGVLRVLRCHPFQTEFYDPFLP